MPRADDSHDNAWAESFWSRMKAELDKPKGGYETIEKMKSDLFEHHDGYYNTRMQYSSLNYLNPAAFKVNTIGNRDES